MSNDLKTENNLCGSATLREIQENDPTKSKRFVSKRITHNLLFALQLINQLKHWTSVRFLVNQLQVSDRTVFRYIEDLKSEGFQVEEMWHFGKRMYRVRSYPTEVNYLINQLSELTKEELASDGLGISGLPRFARNDVKKEVSHG